jgi:SAM-dependent methyltransferase
MSKIKFLDLGEQPVANNFLKSTDEFEKEYFYNLSVCFDTNTKLVSLEKFVEPERMFNDSYVYRASMSKTMRKHFKEIASNISDKFNSKKILEIGSNDGVFIKNFSKESTFAVEPCKNFSDFTNSIGYKTYNNFWDLNLSKKILKENGQFDLIFSANCMCHIQDIEDAFKSISKLIKDDGIFIFEDPSLLSMIERGSYDQIYDEHAHIFSIIALKNLLEIQELEIFDIEKLSVHGGSNRIYVSKKGKRKITNNVKKSIEEEIKYNLDKIETYYNFTKRVEQSKIQLVNILKELKRKGNKIISYGATSKSTTVFNYCKINNELIDYIVDTTPEKQNKFSPGMRIPVISPEEGMNDSVDYAFLGAWNFSKEISDKEKEFLKKSKFITHVPYVRFL